MPDITMDTQYPVALTAWGCVTNVTMAGPKKKEPVATGADG
jgi:hypothetical protein